MKDPEIADRLCLVVVECVQSLVPFVRKFFVSQERVSCLPRERADLRGSLGNFQGSLGNLLSYTARELLGKLPGILVGNFGELPGKSGDFESFQNLGGA